VDLPAVPTAVLGRTNLRTTKLGLGTATFVARRTDEEILAVLRAARASSTSSSSRASSRS
jgi:aryl-alcohol dehydrogenase-like predicted oxidoreductase